ncbi:MAG: MFS transporter, partial [Acidimicrobiia bacterium]|nr:MFS transporter [Acidimicrobiia bacterium]
FVVASAVFLAMGAANGFAVLFVAGLLSGVANGTGNQATNKYISSEVPIERRGIITGVKQSGVMAGVFFAGMLLPRGVVTIGYRPTMFVVSALALVAMGVMVLVLPADPVAAPRRGERRAPLPSSIRWLAGYAALMGGAIGCQSAFLALYAEEDLALSRTTAGFVVGMTGLAAVGGRIVLGRLTQTVESYAPVLAAMSLLACVGFGVIRLAGVVGGGLLVILPFITAFSTSSWNAPVMLASMRLVPAADAGRSAGLIMTGFMGGYAVGPPIFGAAVDRLGSYDTPWLAAIGLCLGAAALMLTWRRQEQRAMAAAAAPGSAAPGSVTPGTAGSAELDSIAAPGS